MTASNFIVSYKAFLPIQRKLKGGGGGKIVVGTVLKAKIGELEEDVRAVSSRRMWKYLSGGVQGVSGKKRLLARFQDVCKNNISVKQFPAVNRINMFRGKGAIITRNVVSTISMSAQIYHTVKYWQCAKLF